MAQARLLSRSLGSSRRFNALKDVAGDLAEFSQLLFTLIIPHTDDFGRMAGDPFTIHLSVFPASARTVDEFQTALHFLHDVNLVTVYQVGEDIWLQISKFEAHQQGLHKRTKSRIPPHSGKFREFPGNSGSRARAEEKRNETNRTETKRREEDDARMTVVAELRGETSVRKSGGNGNGGARGKRPIFSGQRITIFEWQFDDFTRILGPLTDDFHLDEWFYALDAEIVKSAVIVPQRDSGAWLQSQLIAEAQRRGLPTVTIESPRAHAPKSAARLAYYAFECPHLTPCSNRNACKIATELSRPLKASSPS